MGGCKGSGRVHGLRLGARARRASVATPCRCDRSRSLPLLCAPRQVLARRAAGAPNLVQPTVTVDDSGDDKAELAATRHRHGGWDDDLSAVAGQRRRRSHAWGADEGADEAADGLEQQPRPAPSKRLKGAAPGAAAAAGPSSSRAPRALPPAPPVGPPDQRVFEDLAAAVCELQQRPPHAIAAIAPRSCSYAPRRRLTYCLLPSPPAVAYEQRLTTRAQAEEAMRVASSYLTSLPDYTVVWQAVLDRAAAKGVSIRLPPLEAPVASVAK